MADHSTLLRCPNERDFPSRMEEMLPELLADYEVEQARDVWKVTAIDAGKLAYWGQGL
jgi:hypothetical protein